jgi:putative ABC transport system permease protein
VFVALRDLRFAKGRFALMGAVIALITVLVGLVSGLTAGLARESTSAITGLPVDHLAFDRPADGDAVSFTDSSVSEAEWRGWARVPGVQSAEPLGIAPARAESDAHSVSVSAFGVLPGSALAPAGESVATGSAVLSEQAADDLRVSVGATVSLSGHPLVVSAIAGDASYSHTPVVWVSLNDWQRLPGGSPGEPRATVIALTTAPGTDLAVADRLLGTTTVSRGDALGAIGSYTAENGSLQLMRGFLFAISALVVGAFFTVWTIQRGGDVAVLKALGASTGYLLRDALGQAVIVLVAGTALGTAVAAAVGAAVRGAVPFVLDLPTMIIPAVVLIVLGAVGSALSICRITSVDPLIALGSAR